jgi:hypothetical protein
VTDPDFMPDIIRLTNARKFGEIVSLIQEIPEHLRDTEIIGHYVRALNNTYDYEEAVKVSLKHKDRDGNTALWNYRLGYAYAYLGHPDAEATLLRGRELANSEQIRWIDEVLEFVRVRKNKVPLKRATEEKRKAAFTPHDPSKPYFQGLNLSSFWEYNDWARKSYVGTDATEDMFDHAEQSLGYKLPESYKFLVRHQNGGIPKLRAFAFSHPLPFEPDAIEISSIWGVDPSKDSITGDLGSAFMISEWGYPNIGVAICDCPSAGHDMVFLDYRDCGPDGEPTVVHIDQESDYDITWLAGDFESFVLGLRERADEWF